jgi:hypothetical protein
VTVAPTLIAIYSAESVRLALWQEDIHRQTKFLLAVLTKVQVGLNDVLSDAYQPSGTLISHRSSQVLNAVGVSGSGPMQQTALAAPAIRLGHERGKAPLREP